jgi:hypothetical protein
MAYTPDMTAAARRLASSATKLLQPDNRAVAAYLFGLAAECALKAVAARSPGGMADEIQYAHFPSLRTALRHWANGRGAIGLRRLIESDAFMNQWAIDIRYARAADIHDKPVEQWREQATSALNIMDGWA